MAGAAVEDARKTDQIVTVSLLTIVVHEKIHSQRSRMREQRSKKQHVQLVKAFFKSTRSLNLAIEERFARILVSSNRSRAISALS